VSKGVLSSLGIFKETEGERERRRKEGGRGSGGRREKRKVERSGAGRKERQGNKGQIWKAYSVIRGGGSFIENMPEWWEPVGRWQTIGSLNTHLYCIPLGYDHSTHSPRRRTRTSWQ